MQVNREQISEFDLMRASMSHVRYWEPVVCSSVSPAEAELQLQLNLHLLGTVLSSTGVTECCPLEPWGCAGAVVPDGGYV